MAVLCCGALEEGRCLPWAVGQAPHRVELAHGSPALCLRLVHVDMCVFPPLLLPSTCFLHFVPHLDQGGALCLCKVVGGLQGADSYRSKVPLAGPSRPPRS